MAFIDSATMHKLPKRTRRGGRRRNRRRASLAESAGRASVQTWPPLVNAVSYVSDSEDSVSSALTELSSSSSPARSRANSFSSVSSSSTSSTSSSCSTASRWWHTRADTDDYDDNISWRTAFDGSDLGLNLASAARTPLISSLTVFPTDTRLVEEAVVEEDDETDGLFADVVPNLLALVDGVAKAPVVADVKAPPAPAKVAPVAAAVVTDDDATDEEAKARAVRRARHEKRRSRNLRKLEHRAARAAQKAAAADAFDAACAEFSC